MAQKKQFSITTPRGSITTVQTDGGIVTAKLEWNPAFASQKAESFSKAQAFVDSECLRYMNPLSPRRTGMMIKSATLGTVIGSRARWFETMKASKKDVIREGAEKLAAR